MLAARRQDFSRACRPRPAAPTYFILDTLQRRAVALLFIAASARRDDGHSLVTAARSSSELQPFRYRLHFISDMILLRVTASRRRALTRHFAHYENGAAFDDMPTSAFH